MCKNQDKEVVVLQEMYGYAIDQVADEMEAAEEEWKQSGSPSVTPDEAEAALQKIKEKMKENESR